MTMLLVAVVAAGAGLLVVLIGAALQAGAWPTGEDAAGLGSATVVASVMLIVGLYWPILAVVSQRVRLTPSRGALITAGAINAPLYVTLAIIGQSPALFAGGEPMLIASALAASAAVFGAGYARLRRQAAS